MSLCCGSRSFAVRSAVKCKNSFISVTNTTLMCVLLLLSFLMKFIKCAIRESVVCTYIPGLMRLCHCLLMFIRPIFQSSFFCSSFFCSQSLHVAVCFFPSFAKRITFCMNFVRLPLVL